MRTPPFRPTPFPVVSRSPHSRLTSSRVPLPTTSPSLTTMHCVLREARPADSSMVRMLDELCLVGEQTA